MTYLKSFSSALFEHLHQPLNGGYSGRHISTYKQIIKRYSCVVDPGQQGFVNFMSDPVPVPGSESGSGIRTRLKP
jgi:hypothetical protein